MFDDKIHNTITNGDVLETLWPGMSLSKANTCKHYTCAFVGGKPVIVILSALSVYCHSAAKIHYVGLGDVPEPLVLKVLAEFKKFPYCPKCGATLDFVTLAERRVQKEKEGMLI